MTPLPPPGHWLGRKAEMIERSRACLVGGCLGLVPILGAPAALWALHEYRQVRLLQGADWNPARPHLRVGVGTALLGLLGSLAAVTGALMALAANAL